MFRRHPEPGRRMACQEGKCAPPPTQVSASGRKEHDQEKSHMSNRNLPGAAMVLLPAMALLSAIVSPAAAQQPSRQQHAYNQDVASPTQHDNLRTVAANVSAQRAELFRKKDAAGIAALYMPDATFVELLARLDVMRGRSQIQAHFQELMAATATNLMPAITSAEMG